MNDEEAMKYIVHKLLLTFRLVICRRSLLGRQVWNSDPYQPEDIFSLNIIVHTLANNKHIHICFSYFFQFNRYSMMSMERKFSTDNYLMITRIMQ